MTWAILSINIKGGTGKSTIAQQLAYGLRDAGHDVGVMDADIDSANLASRFGTSEKVTFKGDHIIEPVEHDDLKIYSMENAFEDSSFSQTGAFMGTVIDNMVESSEWGDLDYLVVDCPPGSSDVFEHLVRALRANLLGAISVGISDAVEDTARLVKVCNHNWVPILGFVENMSGVYCHDEEVTCDAEGHAVHPFGEGQIEDFASQIGGNFIGGVPLCTGNTELSEVAEEPISNMVAAVEDADKPPLPEDNLGEKGFIRNVWGSIKTGIQNLNTELPVSQIQEKFGVEGRDPLVMQLELTDAGAVTGIFSDIVITVDEGRMKVMRPSNAKRKGKQIEGGIKISSQDLNDAIRGEKKVMRAVSGDITTEPYSITDAVKMGDAEVWGDKAINRIAVLDRIFSEVVPMGEVQEIMNDQPTA